MYLSLHVKVATLPWKSPLDLRNFPLANELTKFVHAVAVHALSLVMLFPFQVIAPLNPGKHWHAVPDCPLEFATVHGASTCM